MKSCFFIGHSDTPESVCKTLELAIRRCIEEYHITEFIVGHYGNFDRMAAGVVREMKKEYKGIRLLLLLPYLPTEKDIVWMDFDEILYPEGLETVPRRFAILRANQWAAKNCDIAITYINRTYGGAYQTYWTARKYCKVIDLVK